jgi:ligand-binding SRPBCC domain-containing protein
MGTCCVKALISVPLPHLWNFIIRPENMHLWGPLSQPVTGIDRPLRAGDRVTQLRKDFFRRYSQVLLVEEVIPYRSLCFRDLSSAGLKFDARAAIRVEETSDREATLIEETISYSLGTTPTVQWLDCRLVNPVLQRVVGHKTNRAFRRLQALVGRPDKKHEALD